MFVVVVVVLVAVVVVVVAAVSVARSVAANCSSRIPKTGFAL